MPTHDGERPTEPLQETGERDPIRPKCDDCEHYCTLHGPSGCHVPDCECEQSPSFEPLQDGGEQEAIKAAFHADGRPISGFAAFEAGWIANSRHPHQDVERLTRERDDARRFHTAEHTDRVDAEAEVERLREALTTIASDECMIKRATSRGTWIDVGEPQRIAQAALAPSPDDRGGERG